MFIIYNFITYFPSIKEFIPDISYSFKFKIDLKKVIPTENISFFSGINYPYPNPK